MIDVIIRLTNHLSAGIDGISATRTTGNHAEVCDYAVKVRCRVFVADRLRLGTHHATAGIDTRTREGAGIGENAIAFDEAGGYAIVA